MQCVVFIDSLGESGARVVPDVSLRNIFPGCFTASPAEKLRIAPDDSHAQQPIAQFDQVEIKVSWLSMCMVWPPLSR
jgi:hypothetical protein